MRVAAPVPLGRMVGAVSWGWMPEPLRARVPARLPRLGAALNFRCAAHEYRLAAGGHAHLLVYNKLMPWDHAPGWLLHAEAGGHAAQFDGGAYDPARQRSGGLLCAPDRASWQAARDALLGDA
jgi:fructose-1,6-bisphosphatase/inositol monophosphatase family enzyme